MISKYKTVLDKGEIVKMKLAPRDPINPFKGKYLHLTFDERRFKTEKKEWKRNEDIFLHYHINTDRYLKVDSISSEIFSFENVMKVKVSYFANYDNRLEVKYPFEKYFIEESKALPAEQKIRELLRNKHSNVYAEISVLNSIPVLKEVYVDGVPILEFLANN
jgi:uncharacterized membrane-anchored protein